MTSPIDRELLPPSGDGARLPALGTPDGSPAFLARVKEILEILLGRRGASQWDRAVTFRDLYGAGIAAPVTGGGAWQLLPQAGPQQGTSDYSNLRTQLENDLKASPGFKNLIRQIGSADDLAMFPDEIRTQLAQSLAQVARDRKADIVTIERKVQTNALSLASRLSELTAALETHAAGVRRFDAAYADRAQALAISINQVTARLNNPEGDNVTVEEKLSAQASDISGLQGQWSVKIQAGSDANPIIAGIDLSVTSPSAGTGTSALIFMADKFGFVLADGSHGIPFAISGSRIQFNGDVTINGSLALGSTGLQPGFEAPGTLNSAISISSNGALSGGGGGQVTLGGIGFSGNPNATSDLVLVGRGVAINGNNAIRTAAYDGSWDADAYSRDSFTGGAYVSVVAADTIGRVMAGLNSDPTYDTGYASIDYAIYQDAGTAEVYESGASRGTFGSYVAGDVFAVVYDGSSVKYLKNGAVFYTSVTASASQPNQKLYFDSSFFDLNAQLKNIRFGPLSSNNWSSIGGTGKPADNATVGADWSSNLSGKPDDALNLVHKSTFEDGNFGQWAAASVVAVAGQPFTKAVEFNQRDTPENNNAFPVVPGETLYADAWLDASTTTYTVALGFRVDDAAGNTINWYFPAAAPSGAGWAHYSGSQAIPANGAKAIPWLWISGSSGFGTARAANLRITRFQPGATVGAPSGTNVGGTPATTVESNAANGQSAYTAVNDATTGLATKLANNARSVLSGGAGLAVGSLTWDATGARTGGYGLGLNANGLVHYASDGTLDVSIGSLGIAVKGDISGSTGTFGAVTVGSSLSFGQTAYNTGNGGWIQGGATPKMSMRSASGQYFLCDPGNSILEMNGVKLVSPSMNTPVVNAGTDITSTGSTGTRTVVTRTATVTGGNGSVKYAWTCVVTSSLDGTGDVWINGAADTATVTVKARSSSIGDQLRATLTCAATDDLGLTGTDSFIASVNF